MGMDHIKLRKLCVLMIKMTERCTFCDCWLRNLGTVW